MSREADLQRRLQKYRRAYMDKECEELAASLQRDHAIECLLQIIEGPDPEGAKERAQGWLKRFYKKDYAIRVDLHTRIIPEVMTRLHNVLKDDRMRDEIRDEGEVV